MGILKVIDIPLASIVPLFSFARRSAIALFSGDIVDIWIVNMAFFSGNSMFALEYVVQIFLSQNISAPFTSGDSTKLGISDFL